MRFLFWLRIVTVPCVETLWDLKFVLTIQKYVLCEGYVT